MIRLLPVCLVLIVQHGVVLVAGSLSVYCNQADANCT